MGTIYGLQKLTKHRFLGKFESYNTIHNFKNYFVTVFSTINFFIFSISAVSKHALSMWDARVPRREERPLTNRKERKAVKLEPPQSFSPSSRRPCPGDAWWFRCTVQYIYQMNELYSLYCFAIDAYVANDLVNVYCIITFEYAIQLFDEMPVWDMATASS